jgi:uncharacterized protein (TIGR00251 family)
VPWLLAVDGLVLKLRVTPGARRSAIDGAFEDADGELRLKVAVPAAPSDGAANKAVVALLAKTWRMPKSAFSIAAGVADRRKTLHIAGDPVDLVARLDRWWQASGMAT